MRTELPFDPVEGSIANRISDYLQLCKLKVVGRAGIGVDNIDVQSATSRGIIVMNTPQANAVATAEHTMALMLAITRHVAPAHDSVSAGEWRRADFVGQQLYRKVLGIIGFGHIDKFLDPLLISLQVVVVAVDHVQTKVYQYIIRFEIFVLIGCFQTGICMAGMPVIGRSCFRHILPQFALIIYIHIAPKFLFQVRPVTQ